MQERRAEERRQAEEQREQEYEAEQARREELRETRKATFERILANAPDSFSAAQLRMLLRALVNLDPYTFARTWPKRSRVETRTRSVPPRRFCWGAIDSLADEKLTGFTLRLALSSHLAIPREGRWTSWLSRRPHLLRPTRRKSAAGSPANPLLSRPRRLQRRRRPQPKPRSGSQVTSSRSFTEEGGDHIPVHVQAQDRRAGQGQVRPASPLQPAAGWKRRHQRRMVDCGEAQTRNRRTTLN